MPEQQYTYAVARIRSKELGLLNRSFLEQLITSKRYEDCLRLLADKGWGSGSDGESAEAMLAEERTKTWSLIAELVSDMSVFDVFLYPNDYHNLKAAIKQVCTEETHENVFLKNATLEPEAILAIVREHEFGDLPEHMRGVAREAFETLLHTRDGQLCDLILDKGALDAVFTAGKAAENDLMRLYAELTVAAADIKIAVRCMKTGKPLDLIRRSLAQCDTLNPDLLAHAAINGLDAICGYLEGTAYADAVPALRESPSAFERWCDDLMMREIRPQLYNAFTVGPLAAYILGRENELKTVRIILSGKLNDLPEESIRERVRETYV